MDATIDRLLRTARARGFAPELQQRRRGTWELFLLQRGADPLYPGVYFVLELNPAVFASGGPTATTITLSVPGREGGEYDVGTLPSLAEALAFAAWRLAATLHSGCAGCGRLVMEELACPYDRGFCLDCCRCDEHAGMPPAGGGPYHPGVAAPDDLRTWDA